MVGTLCPNCIPEGYRVPSGTAIIRCDCGYLKPLGNIELEMAYLESQDATSNKPIGSKSVKHNKR